MKILAIGDPHGKLPSNLKGIINKNKIEVIVVTGELPCVPMEVYEPKKLKKFGERYADKNYKEMLDKLCSHKLPVLILRGNTFTVTGGWNKFSSKLFSKYKNLYYKRTGKFRIKGKNFVVFDMIWEPWAYRTRTKMSKKFFNRASSCGEARINKLNKYLKTVKDPILISHAPPYGYLDKVPGVGHVGSKIVLKAIKKYKPKLILCGHIHEGRGKKKIGKTVVINAGSRGEFYVVDVK